MKIVGAPVDFTARYEALRTYAIDRQAPASREGLVVLLRQGLASWMDAWSRLAAPSLRPPRAERLPAEALPAQMSSEVVHLLAAMTSIHVQGVPA